MQSLLRDGLEIVLEEESVNDVKALKKSLTAALKTFSVTIDEVLVCAEYTGRSSRARTLLGMYDSGRLDRRKRIMKNR